MSVSTLPPGHHNAAPRAAMIARDLSLRKGCRMRRCLLEQPRLVFTAAVIAMLWTDTVLSLAQEKKKEVIPHAQDKPPNEPRDPQTAAKMMTVPEGFSVEVVAAEPDIVNP